MNRDCGLSDCWWCKLVILQDKDASEDEELYTRSRKDSRSQVLKILKKFCLSIENGSTRYDRLG